MFEENTKTIHMRDELNKLSISSDDKKKNAEKLKKIMKLFSEGKTFSQLPERLAGLVGEKFPRKCKKEVYDKKVDDIVEKIKDKYDRADMEQYFDEDTLRDWLTGKKNPQFTSDPEIKEKVIQFFFVFNMDREECETFASKAFFIQAFNIRDIRDLIALYCTKDKISYDYKAFLMVLEKACNIINKDDNEECVSVPNCTETVILKERFKEVNTEEKLIRFIEDNKAVFKDDHIFARNFFNDRLYKKVKELCDIVDKKEMRSSTNKNKGENIEMNITEYTSESNDDNTDLPSPQKFKVNGNVKDLFEIMNPKRWSEVRNYTGNSNDLRKLIIYFHFYVYYKKYHKKNENPEPKITEIDNLLKDARKSIEDELKKFINNDGNTNKETLTKMDSYKRTVNALMVKCNFQPLYLRNPYDCIFIYSAGCQHPIETLQWLLAEITDNWPDEEDYLHKGVRRTKDDNQPSDQMISNLMSGNVRYEPKKGKKRKNNQQKKCIKRTT